MPNYCGVAVSVALLLGVAACGGGEATLPTTVSRNISGEVKEWAVEVDENSTAAGEITFSVTNNGSIGHEFLIVKTDIADGKIPLSGDHFDEEETGIEVINEIGEFAAGTSSELTVNLPSGSYQLVCNLPGHYKAGMHTTFTVTS